MQHVRVGEHDAAALARGAPRVARRVAVVDDRAEPRSRRRRSARAGCAPDRARAPWSGRGRARVALGSAISASSTGRWKQRLLPLAVGVAMTTCAPRERGRRRPAPGGCRARRCRAAASARVRAGRERLGQRARTGPSRARQHCARRRGRGGRRRTSSQSLDAPRETPARLVCQGASTDMAGPILNKCSRTCKFCQVCWPKELGPAFVS